MWASQFVTSRCFGWFLPSTFLAPMIDMVNHYPDDQCTTEVIHLGWEVEKSKSNRERVGYRRLCKKFDLAEVLESKKEFPRKRNKTGLITFVE
jgi:hypothetical protein